MLTRRELFDILHQKAGEARSSQIEHLFNYLVQYFNIEVTKMLKNAWRKSAVSFAAKFFQDLISALGTESDIENDVSDLPLSSDSDTD